MNATVTYSIWLSIIMMILISGCGESEEEIQAKVQEYYQTKVAELKIKKQAECKAEALRIAEVIADSIVYHLQINPLSDSLYQPSIPERPKYIPVDSSVFDSKHSVKPIL